MTKPT